MSGFCVGQIMRVSWSRPPLSQPIKLWRWWRFWRHWNRNYTVVSVTSTTFTIDDLYVRHYVRIGAP